MASSLLILSGCSERMASTNRQDIQKVSYPLAVIETSAGTMELELWNDVAPGTVDNFTKLANEKFYDTTAFHRIIDGFMIQGGCPFTKPGGNMALAGTGDPGYKIELNFVTRVTSSCQGHVASGLCKRTTSLNHKPINNSMERRRVVKLLICKFSEIIHCPGGHIIPKLQFHCPCTGLNHREGVAYLLDILPVCGRHTLRTAAQN